MFDKRLAAGLCGILLGTAALLSGCGQPAAPPARARVILIGIDGGSWNLIDSMLEAGDLPHLAAIRERGVTAELATVTPVISPTVWTSIATGRSPEAHGVSFFYAKRHSVQVPTLWERFAAAGLRVGLYDHLLTWPPPRFPGGFVVPGWLRRDDTVWPPDLFERAGLSPYFYSMAGVDGPEAMVATVERETAEKARYWNRMAEKFEIDVGAVIFYSVDAVSHQFWHAAFPEDFDHPITGIGADPRFAGTIHETLRGIDRSVGEILAALGPEDQVVIVSDHGFQARRAVGRRWRIHSPRVLQAAGVEPARDGITVMSDFVFLTLKVDPGPADEREASLQRLRDLVASIRTQGGEPLFRTDAVHVPARPSEATDKLGRGQVKVIETEQPAYAFLFASPRKRVLQQLSADDLIEVGGERFPLNEFATSLESAGGHHPTGIFLAAGSRIRHRPQRAQISVLDVAPLLSYLAGQAIPDDLEGHFPDDLIEPGYLLRNPPRWIPAAEVPRLAEDGAVDAEGIEDSELDERLRALGYI